MNIVFPLWIRPEVQKTQPEMELTGMNICMFLHIGFLMESFSTVWAREGSGIGVNKKMCRECWRSFELFFTNVTFINLKINIIMIVNLAKIRESKLAKRNWWFWIWQKIVPALEMLQYVNFTSISENLQNRQFSRFYQSNVSVPIFTFSFLCWWSWLWLCWWSMKTFLFL